MILNPSNRFLRNEEVSPADPNAGGGGPAAVVVDPPAVVDAPVDPPAPGAATVPPDAGSPPVRPEYLPEKFWKDGKPDLESLGKSYQSLESAFHTKHPLSADLPATPSEYALKPEKLPDGVVLPDEVLGRFQTVFHAKGIGQAAAAEIVGEWAKIEAENLAQANAALEKKIDTDRAALAAKWGGEEKYNARREEVAALVTEKLGADPTDAALFNNPRVVEFLASTADYVKALEKQLGEDALAAAKGSVAPGPAFTSGAGEAQRIMKDPSHPEHDAYRNGDVNVQKKVLKLLGGE